MALPLRINIAAARKSAMTHSTYLCHLGAFLAFDKSIALKCFSFVFFWKTCIAYDMHRCDLTMISFVKCLFVRLRRVFIVCVVRDSKPINTCKWERNWGNVMKSCNSPKKGNQLFFWFFQMVKNESLPIVWKLLRVLEIQEREKIDKRSNGVQQQLPLL